jgi:hypothetical protein
VVFRSQSDPELPKLQRGITLWLMYSTTSRLVQGNLGGLMPKLLGAAA